MVVVGSFWPLIEMNEPRFTPPFSDKDRGSSRDQQFHLFLVVLYVSFFHSATSLTFTKKDFLSLFRMNFQEEIDWTPNFPPDVATLAGRSITKLCSCSAVLRFFESNASSTNPLYETRINNILANNAITRLIAVSKECRDKGIRSQPHPKS